MLQGPKVALGLVGVGLPSPLSVRHKGAAMAEKRGGSSGQGLPEHKDHGRRCKYGMKVTYGSGCATVSRRRKKSGGTSCVFNESQEKKSAHSGALDEQHRQEDPNDVVPRRNIRRRRGKGSATNAWWCCSRGQTKKSLHVIGPVSRQLWGKKKKVKESAEESPTTRRGEQEMKTPEC